MTNDEKQQLRSNLFQGAVIAAKNRDGVSAKAFVDALLEVEHSDVPFGARAAGLDSGTVAEQREYIDCLEGRLERLEDKLRNWPGLRDDAEAGGA